MGIVFEEIFRMLNHPMFWMFVFASATGYIIVKAAPTVIFGVLYIIFYILGRITYYLLFAAIFIWEVLKGALGK